MYELEVIKISSSFPIRKETKHLSCGYSYFALNETSYLLINTITAFVTIITYVLLGNSIDSAKVFTVYSILNAMLIPLSYGIPEAIRSIVYAKVSFRRIKVFINFRLYLLTQSTTK